MSDKLKCRDCIWLDTKNKSKAGFYACLNTNIKHTRLGHLRYPTSLACVKGFEGFEGQTIERAPKRTYEQGYADAIDEMLDAIAQEVAYSYKTLNYSKVAQIAEQLKEQKNE